MEDVDAGRCRLALNRIFRKARANVHTECRVCNFKNRSVVVVNATGDNAKVNELIRHYCDESGVTTLVVDFQGTEAVPTLWVLA